MDNRVKEVIEKEKEKKQLNIELRERYRRLLKRTLVSMDSSGKERVVYENEGMIEHVQEELESQVLIMSGKYKELKSCVAQTEKKMQKYKTQDMQNRVELLNQQIRILEAAVRYIN